MLTRVSKPTVTPFGLHCGETCQFTLQDGQVWRMQLLDTAAEIIERDYARYNYHENVDEGGEISVYAFSALVKINGQDYLLRREVGTQASFYEPWVIDDVRIWLDAVAVAFTSDGGFMREKDWRYGWICAPYQSARFVIHEADLPICPEPLLPWYPNESNMLNISDCYNGEDCWMGPYDGAFAHCGLDINMPYGTVLTSPFTLDDQYVFNSVAAGFNNNRWRGVRRWPDGSEWWIQSHHLIDMLVPAHQPLLAGAPYATTAGTFVGSHEHTHFMFHVHEQGGEYLLDPWILFWAIFRQGGA